VVEPALPAVGQISWRRLFLAGLATGVCYTGLAVYIAYVMSSSIVSDQARYGPIGTVMTLITAEIGLAVALQLGAAIGASRARLLDLAQPTCQAGIIAE
jgi:membrane protein